MDFLHIMTGRSILKNSRKLQILQRGECYLLAVALTLTHSYTVYAEEVDRGPLNQPGKL